MHRNLEQVGAPRFTGDEKAFARRTQAPLGRPFELALSETIEPLPDRPGQGLASTDIGDISWFVPVGQLTAMTHTFGAPGHSWQIVACTGTTIGEKGMMVAAKALAGTAIDVYVSSDLLARARADFKKVRDPLRYLTLIPEGQRRRRQFDSLLPRFGSQCGISEHGSFRERSVPDGSSLSVCLVSAAGRWAGMERSNCLERFGSVRT
jgi:hypothetical protein